MRRRWILSALVVWVGLALAWGALALPAHAAPPPPPSEIPNPKSQIQSPPSDITVGDVFTVTLAVDHAAGTRVLWPALPQAWGAFEVRAQATAVSTSNPDGSLTSRQPLRLTLWAPGVYATPPLTVTIAAADGALQTAAAAPITVTVASVLAGGDALRDLKPQASLGAPPAWPWLLGGGLGAALLAAAAVWAWRRRGAAETAVPPLLADDRPAHVVALAELEAIAALRLPAAGRFGEQYTRVTDVLRRYLEDDFGVPALDRTTAELRQALLATPLPAAARDALHALLAEADLVKFARVTPDPAAAESLPAQARRWIQDAHHTLTPITPSPHHPHTPTPPHPHTPS